MPLDWREVDPTKERKSVQFALETIFEDGLMPRRERDEEGGEDGASMRKIGKADAGYGCVGLGTGGFRDSNQTLAESSKRTLLFAVEGLLKM